MWRQLSRKNKILVVVAALALVAVGVVSSLNSGPSLVGRVRNAGNEMPLEGATIRAGDQQTRSDAKGRFNLPLEPGVYDVVVGAPGYTAQAFTVTISAEVEAYYELNLAVPQLRGVVLDEDGAPLAGAELRLGTVLGRSDEAGAFVIDGMEGYDLEVSCAGCATAAVPAEEITARLLTDEAEREPVTVTVEPAVLAGTASELYPDGSLHPAAGITVTVGERAAATDAEGRYRLEYPVAGQPLGVDSPFYRPLAEAIVYTGQAEQDLTLEPWLVEVAVAAADGSPLAGAEITDAELGESGPTAATGDDGRALAHTAPGRTLHVSLRGFAPAEVAYNGEETLSVTLEQASLTGRLWDGDTDAPVANALVQGLAHADDLQATAMVRTDAEGRFTIDDATALEMVRIKAPGYRVVEQPLEDLAPIELALEPFEVRAIYIGLGLLSVPDYTLGLLDMAAESELNAVVVDVKGDRAYIAWPSELPLAQEIGAYAGDDVIQMPLEEFVAEAQARGLYTIARMVMFKDNVLAAAHPEWSPKWEDGSLYYDYEDLLWASPYVPEVRQYNIDLALEVAAMGFDEIQLDYLRFPSDGKVLRLEYYVGDTLIANEFEDRTAAMGEFCAEMYTAISATPAFLAADIFGLTVWVNPTLDMGIGQRVEDIAPHMDYLCPMLYPQTFGPGNLDYDNPELYPYEVVYRSVRATRRRTDTLVRPWLQHYSISVDYGATELLKQMAGADNSNSCGWMYWNAGGKYDESIFLPNAVDRLPPLPDLEADVVSTE